jgi:hypothetical protein
MNSINTKILMGLMLILAFSLGYTAPVQGQTTYTLTLVDESEITLANYPADYSTETRNLKYKYRCGGSWTSDVSFQTDASGQFEVSIGCDNWDNKVTVTLNQTSKEQDVTLNPIFQAAKVNANLTTCIEPITEMPGGTVAQGGGYWYTHGTTGPSGTVSFYTFPGNITLRMSYNHNSKTLNPTIVTGINEVDFQTTELTINHDDEVKSNKGGSWWMFSKPSMDLLPGDYPFYFKTGPIWDGPITISVIGCSMDYTYQSNQPPVANPGGPYLGAVNMSIAFDGTGSSDPDGGPLTYDWTFGDGESVDDAGATPDYSYSSAGIYDVCLTVNDGFVDSDEVCTIAVVYDPSAGFVTGGGWIWSPEGAYTADPDLVGKATFGFVAKYKKGATVPDGNTEFQFKAGDLNFHSSSYDWLVVNQNDSNAQFKGSGTINGEGDYKFMLWAGDKEPDTFRIKIWEEIDDTENIIYDNGVAQEIGGGSIVVHSN